MIVLNGEPFIRANLRALYPFAHQIIVVEGASPHAAESATVDGHSRDATLQIIRDFVVNEDPARKIVLVTAEDEGHPNGFWPREKTQQSQAYASRATGDWLWQVDVDEFYAPPDVDGILAYLAVHPEVSCVTFGAHHFFGDSEFVVEGGFFQHPYYQGEIYGRYRRIFRWQPGWCYAAHRPPIIFDERGQEVTRRKVVNAGRILGRTRVMYHYFMPSAEVILRKARYYSRIAPKVFSGREQACTYLLANLTAPACWRVFDQYGTWNWVSGFRGSHPPEIRRLIADGKLSDPGLAAGFKRIVSLPSYLVVVALLRVGEMMRSHGNAVWYLIKSKLISCAPRFPAWLWRVLPGRWRCYREDTWQLEPWCAEIVVRLKKADESKNMCHEAV